MHITLNQELFFVTENTMIITTSLYGATVFGILLLSLIVELLSFLKWYMTVRKRITSNCLNSLVDLNKDQKQFKIEQRKIRLKVIERIFVTFLHFLIRAMNLFIIVIIMETYNIGYIIVVSFGFGIGHLIFGLIRDSIVIR